MPIQFQCSSCRSTLQVPDNLSGRKVRCPKCRGVADVIPSPAGFPAAVVPGPATAEDKGSPRFRTDQDEVRVRARKPAPVPEPEVEDADEVEERPARPIRSGSRRQEAISTRPLRRNEPTDAEDEEESEQVERPRRLHRRIKRRRRKLKSDSTPKDWRWLWYVAGSVVYLVVAAALVIHMIATGHTVELIVHAIQWGVLMPVTLVIFFVSMFISSAIAGGIDFGDLRTAIPKAMFLLIPVNFISVLMFGWVGFIITLPILLLGFIVLFGLDPWEARFVVLINWILTRVAVFVLRLILVVNIRGPATLPNNTQQDSADNDRLEAPLQQPPGG